LVKKLSKILLMMLMMKMMMMKMMKMKLKIDPRGRKKRRI